MSNLLTPDYYKGKTGLEPKQVIKEFDLDFFLGNVIKYVCRAGKKPGESKVEALLKAKDNIIDEISKEIEEGLHGNN